MTIVIGDWTLESVRGGDFSIDGGAAFGVVPQTVWKRVYPPGTDNLVRFRCHCLLAKNRHHTILIDTGYGGKYPPLDRKAYLMEKGNPILDDLAAKNTDLGEIDFVLFTHLHFDHAGGATVFDKDRRLVPAFPNAKYLAHAWEWEDAVSAKAELIAAYPTKNLFPLKEHDCVETFRDGDELLPGLTAYRTGGHTRGHCVFLFHDTNMSKGALFLGDLCPTTAHMRLLWNMSYDTFLIETRRKKQFWLEKAAENQWWVLFAHDPHTPGARIERHPKKEFIINNEYILS